MVTALPKGFLMGAICPKGGSETTMQYSEGHPRGVSNPLGSMGDATPEGVAAYQTPTLHFYSGLFLLENWTIYIKFEAKDSY